MRRTLLFLEKRRDNPVKFGFDHYALDTKLRELRQQQLAAEACEKRPFGIDRMRPFEGNNRWPAAHDTPILHTFFAIWSVRGGAWVG